MSKKDRKISFNTLITEEYITHNFEPFTLIQDIIPFIKKLKKLDKQYDLKESKFCLLQSATQKAFSDGSTGFVGHFRSARHKFRPNLIDKETGLERVSPKKISEGDIEKTHFGIKIINNEVFLLLEVNGNGVSILQIVNYFNYFAKRYLNGLGQRRNFSVEYTKLGTNDFLKSIKKLKRVRVAEVYFDKSLMGNGCLNFSNRTSNLKRNIKLTATAEKAESIAETSIDLFNKLSSGKSGISKVRILGNDKNGTEVTLDTSFIEKVDSLSLDLNPITGEIITAEILTGIDGFMNALV